MHVKHREQRACSVKFSLARYYCSARKGCGSREEGAISGETKESFPEEVIFELYTLRPSRRNSSGCKAGRGAPGWERRRYKDTEGTVDVNED